MIHYQETPIVEIHDKLVERAGVRLLVKREDLNHTRVSGNKWWKLKYNLKYAIENSFDSIITFGGAFSNHIYATAAAANEIGLKSVGIIRGEKIEPLNHTLEFAQRQKMQLDFVSRNDYRKKNEPEFLNRLNDRFGNCYIIPEGGTNFPALQGCEEFAREKIAPVEFNVLALPVGTGGTMAGLIRGLQGKKEILGVSVLKGEFLHSEIQQLLENSSDPSYGNWSVLTSYHHGGYARSTKELLDFVGAMKQKHELPLDPVYTGKLMWALWKEIEAGRFPRGTTVLALHTGGMQGRY